MVKEFVKDPSRKKKIPEQELSKPEQTFKLEEFEKNTNEGKEKNKVGRPRKNNTYSTIRLYKHNVNRINALQNTLDYETQNELISEVLDKLERTMDSEQRMMFNMYMKTYEARDNKKLTKKKTTT